MAKDIETIPTNDSIILKANRELAGTDAKRKNLIKTYKEEDKISTYLSPMYRPYLGNVMTVSLSGISIRFKVDGSKQDVPRSFADEIERRRMAIDDVIKKQKRMANISENIESAPGEIVLF